MNTSYASVVPPPAGADQRLLAGWREERRAAGLAAHRARYGPLPLAVAPDDLLTAIELAGLRGRGGAGFPTARKLRAVAAGPRRATVVVNACEGEPVSEKDHTLLALAPHLVLDGAVLAAHAIAAVEIILCHHEGDPLAGVVHAALAERQGDPVATRLQPVPQRYVASEESALVNLINTGDARPTTKPPRPDERGVGGRPTLVSNAETLAQLALIARFGPAWFRTQGTAESPGTTLVTLSGAVGKAGVYEIALGTPIDRVLGVARPAPTTPAVLVGGVGGAWLPLPAACRVPLAHRELTDAGATLGVGALFVLPPDACGLAETARIMHYLAAQSASQCGPCMFGLPALADDLAMLARGGHVGARLRHHLDVVGGRGACRHPDGAVRLARSALHTFAPDVRDHLAGRPCRYSRRVHIRLHRSGRWPR
ncbi:NADH-ubiquinone oxidoreductase-F iron-sulfur binding region domain-containing protein [Actinophytocola sp.]|uniref:NADH-ubiquinone oxidoreductase-F iron-sulfur binding region domain-containing protein n=1 Tax=Actinophytocola sp. TaxID=1872138 RepID=UPI003899E2D4